MTRPQHRIMTLQAAVSWRAALRRDGNRLAVTNGCFDLVHAGHLESLFAARQEGDALLVLVNSDASVRQLKGPTRPVFPVDQRAGLMASLRMVDAVVVFDAANCAAELAALAPDVYAKSEEYRDAQDPAEKAALERSGTEIVWLRRLPGLSSTAALEAAGGLGSSLPRTPTGMVATADRPEYSPVAVAPVSRASTPTDLDAQWDAPPQPAVAGNGAAVVPAAPPPASAPAVGRIDGESEGPAASRLPAASGCVEIPRGGDWGVP